MTPIIKQEIKARPKAFVKDSIAKYLATLR